MSDDAISEYREAIRLEPGLAQAHASISVPFFKCEGVTTPVPSRNTVKQFACSLISHRRTRRWAPHCE